MDDIPTLECVSSPSSYISLEVRFHGDCKLLDQPSRAISCENYLLVGVHTWVC